MIDSLHYIRLERVLLGTNMDKCINEMSESEQIKAVSKNAYAIRLIKNPSELVQMEAVRQNRLAIEHIDNPSETLKNYLN